MREGHVEVSLSAQAVGANSLSANDPERLQCMNPMNQYPSYRVYDAICDWIHRWVRNGEHPPSFPALQCEGTGSMMFGGEGECVTAEHGNVLGGVRLPELEVPIATWRRTQSAPSRRPKTRRFRTE